VKDEVECFYRVAVVKFEEVSQGFPLVERNNGQQGIARQCQVECGIGSSMPVAILLPRGGVAFVVVAVLDAPMLAGSASGTGFFFRPQAGEEDAGVALEGLGFFLIAPLAVHSHGGTCAGESG
jgi:hypothetical protein